MYVYMHRCVYIYISIHIDSGIHVERCIKLWISILQVCNKKIDFCRNREKFENPGLSLACGSIFNAFHFSCNKHQIFEHLNAATDSVTNC